MGLSNLAWELGGLLSAFLFLTSLVPFFGTLLLLASSSLMSSPSTDGLMLRFPSTLSFPPPAVRLCCFLLWGYWPLSCMKEHAEDCGATLNIKQVDRYEQRAEKWIAKNPEQQHTHTQKNIGSMINPSGDADVPLTHKLDKTSPHQALYWSWVYGSKCGSLYHSHHRVRAALHYLLFDRTGSAGNNSNKRCRKMSIPL